MPGNSLAPRNPALPEAPSKRLDRAAALTTRWDLLTHRGNIADRAFLLLLLLGVHDLRLLVFM